MKRKKLGRVQHAIAAAFAENPSRRYTVQELAAIAYPDGPVTSSRLDHASRAVNGLVVPLGLRKDRRALVQGFGWENTFIKQDAFDAMLSRPECRINKPTSAVQSSAQQGADDAA